MSARGEGFPYPANRVGWMDAGGRLSIWVNGGWEISTASGDILPFRLNYSSRQERVSDGILGAGWWVPLLEGSATSVSESTIRITGLGGQSFFLKRSGVVDGMPAYASRDGAWSGVVKGQEFKLSGPGGWKYYYNGGRLSRVEAPGGDLLKWSYGDSNRVNAILGSDRKALVSVRYESNGFVSRIDLANGESFDFYPGRFPVLASEAGIVGISAIVPTTERIIVRGDGGEISRDIVVEVAPDLATSSYNVSFTDGALEDNIAWGGVDGILVSDSVSRYSFEREGSSKSLMRSYADGATEGYKWSQQNFTQTNYLKDGGEAVTSFVGTMGSNFLKVREKRTISSTGEKTRTSRFFDQEGELLRESFERNGLEVYSRRRVDDGWQIDRNGQASYYVKNGVSGERARLESGAGRVFQLEAEGALKIFDKELTKNENTKNGN